MVAHAPQGHSQSPRLLDGKRVELPFHNKHGPATGAYKGPRQNSPVGPSFIFSKRGSVSFRTARAVWSPSLVGKISRGEGGGAQPLPWVWRFKRAVGLTRLFPALNRIDTGI